MIDCLFAECIQGLDIPDNNVPKSPVGTKNVETIAEKDQNDGSSEATLSDFDNSRMSHCE